MTLAAASTPPPMAQLRASRRKMTAQANPQPDVTQLLIQMEHGDRQAVDLLLPIVYRELRRLAGGYLHRERGSHTLQPTALVHEAYLRMVDQSRVQWQNRAHFFGVAAQMMGACLSTAHAARAPASEAAISARRHSAKTSWPRSSATPNWLPSTTHYRSWRSSIPPKPKS